MQGHKGMVTTNPTRNTVAKQLIVSLQQRAQLQNTARNTSYITANTATGQLTRLRYSSGETYKPAAGLKYILKQLNKKEQTGARVHE